MFLWYGSLGQIDLRIIPQGSMIPEMWVDKSNRLRKLYNCYKGQHKERCSEEMFIYWGNSVSSSEPWHQKQSSKCSCYSQHSVSRIFYKFSTTRNTLQHSTIKKKELCKYYLSTQGILQRLLFTDWISMFGRIIKH